MLPKTMEAKSVWVGTDARSSVWSLGESTASRRLRKKRERSVVLSLRRKVCVSVNASAAHEFV